MTSTQFSVLELRPIVVDRLDNVVIFIFYKKNNEDFFFHFYVRDNEKKRQKNLTIESVSMVEMRHRKVVQHVEETLKPFDEQLHRKTYELISRVKPNEIQMKPKAKKKTQNLQINVWESNEKFT